MVGAHGRGGVGHADALDGARVVGGQALALDAGHAAHAEDAAGGGGAAADDAAERRAVADFLEHLADSLGIAVGDAAAGHGHAHGHAYVDGVEADVVAHAVKVDDGVKVADAGMGAEAPQGFVFRPLALELALQVGVEAAAADHAAGHAAVGHLAFAAALLGVLVEHFARHVFMAFELAAGEVLGGQAAGLVEDVDQHGGAEVGKALGDGVVAERLGEALGGSLEGRLVDHGRGFAALGIDDDGLEALGAHDGARAAAAAVAGGTQFAVRARDGGGGQLHLAGAADGDVAALVAVGLAQLGNGVEVVEAGHGCGHELGGVLGELELPPFAFGSDVLDDKGHDAHLGEMAAALAAGVGFLDAAGEGALAANGDAVGVGGVGGAKQARRKDQLVVGADGRTGGDDFPGNDGGRQAAAAEALVLFGHGLEGAFLGRHVDADKLEFHVKPPAEKR